MRAETASLAICICTRNRPKELARCLSSITGVVDQPVEIIVSDDGDLPRDTEGVCAAFAGVKYVRGPMKGLGANRNNCIDQLSPSIRAVAFVDDDVVVRSSFLTGILLRAQFPDEETILTGREFRNAIEVTPRNCSFWGHQEVAPKSGDDYHGLVINSTVFPRSLFSQARFDAALRYGSEEADICAQAEALGYRVKYRPNLTNDHYPSPINREEYPKWVDASRIYATHKRYRWLQGKSLKAWIYSVLAPVHLTLSAFKRGGWRLGVGAMSSVCVAHRFTRAELIRRRSLGAS